MRYINLSLNLKGVCLSTYDNHKWLKQMLLSYALYQASSWCHKLVKFKPPPTTESFSSINICVFKSSKIVSYNLAKE